MTLTPARPRATRLRLADVPAVVRALESDFGRLPDHHWDPRHHYLLDALDRQESSRFVVWGDDQPRAVVHLGLSGTVVPAGDPRAAIDLAPFVDRSRWRIMIGDEPLAQALLDQSTSRTWWRRRPSTRIQRFMVTDGTQVDRRQQVDGFRRGRRADLDQLEEYACALHVEDRMGPPLQGPARAGVRHRMAESIDRGLTWVVERGGEPVAKADLSMHSRARGAQIAGVYVRRDHRGKGLASAMIAQLAVELIDMGMPVVSLHVRDDNTPAIAAYGNAGFTERGRWVLALR